MTINSDSPPLFRGIHALCGHPAFRWLVCCLYGAAICALSLLPGRKLPRLSGTVAHADKIVHFLMYALLAGLLWWALRVRHRARSALVAAVLLGTSLYGLLMEFLQGLLTSGQRCFSVADILANAGGALLAVCIGIKTVGGDR